MKILFIGDAWLGSNARSMADGFAREGHDVRHVDTTRLNRPDVLSVDWTYNRVRRARRPALAAQIVEEIRRNLLAWPADMLFCYKTLHLDQTFLLEIPAKIRVHYSADDVANPMNVTSSYLENERRWSAIITTKHHNVAEIRRRSAVPVLYVDSAYDPAWHHPMAKRGSDHFLLGFIGNRRTDRLPRFQDLARTWRGRMVIAGPGWRRDLPLQRSGATLRAGVYGEDFSQLVSTVDANLVFLNSDNRDTHTCRSFEIPAAGGLFVGERTADHQRLLDDGREALMFEDDAELSYLLERLDRDPAWGSKVSLAGTRRIVNDQHTYQDRAAFIVASLS